ncbi:glucoamylase [Dictyobacter kobayashii]|uniref:Glucoamylase n=2 Tax=Dictyobacter kobayashii TaxID=2014872 RepID=A0A402ARG5_9CHLR|nr:glucoamylase [Dictyobacter kobayashii]
MVRGNEFHQAHSPINAYGVIGDCHSVVLIAPDGSADWACLPDFDSPSIFCRLLDAEHGGYFQIAPTDGSLQGSQRYLHRSNVLQTRFVSEKGAIELTDFLPVETLQARSYEEVAANLTNRHSPRSCLVRMIECTHGSMAVTMRLKVTPHYASVPAEVVLCPDNMGAFISGGLQHVALLAADVHLVPSFTMEIVQDPDAWHPTIQAQFVLHKGESLTFLLGVEDSIYTAHELFGDELLQRDFNAELIHTLQCWRDWIAGCAICTRHGPYAHWVERSALVLKLLTYAPTGALMAAPTTSLPEELGCVRHWDYRFTWLRDVSFTLYAFNTLGVTSEAAAFMDWLGHIPYVDSEDLQVMYGIHDERVLTEQEQILLSGCAGSSPLRIGNGAGRQQQLDIIGGLHLYQCQQQSNIILDSSLWIRIRALVDYVCDHWQEPDSGIWEMRTEPRHFVYSKVMCWVALDRGIRAAVQTGLEADLPRWTQVREQLRAEILERGYDPSLGAFTQSYGDQVLDAANLLLPLVGFLAPDDPRMLSTVERTMELLTNEDGFVYRYRPVDGLPGAEGSCSICTCWLIDNLALQCRVEEAHAIFERLLSCAGNLGLFSEQVDAQGSMVPGNYPQALTHMALINSASNLCNAGKQCSRNVAALDSVENCA